MLRQTIGALEIAAAMNDAEAAAATVLCGGDAPNWPGTQSSKRWVINNPDRVCWYFRTLGAIDVEISAVKAEAARMVCRLELDRDWLKYRHEADYRAWRDTIRQSSQDAQTKE